MIYSQHGSLMEVSNLNTCTSEDCMNQQTLTHHWFRKPSLTPSSLQWHHCSFAALWEESMEQSIICTPSPSQLANLFLSYCFLSNEKSINSQNISLLANSAHPSMIVFFFLYLKWSINYFTESQSRSPLPDEQIPISSISIKDNIVKGGGWVIKSIQEPPTDRVMSWHEEFQHAPLFQDLHVHLEFPITSWAASETIKPLPCFLGSLCHSLILSQHLHQHQVFLCSDLLLMF